MTVEPTAASQRRHTLWLPVIVIAAHAYAFWTFGATFWVDSAVYAGLGGSLFSPEKLGAFYDATGTLMYSHVGPGESALWAFARLFPLKAQWPVLALMQHALAAGATIYAFGNLQRILPGIWNLAVAALFSLHPFYQSFHNALLTESVSSSLFLIGLALLIRIAHDPTPSRRDGALFLLVVFLGTQFRGYFGVLLAASAGIVLLWRLPHFRWKSWLALLAVSLAAIVVFPVYRWACTGIFCSPSGGTNRLVCAAWTNPHPSPELLKTVLALGWHGDPAAIFAQDFNYEKARDAGIAWKSEGLSLSEINRRVRAMSIAIATDHPSSILMQVRCGLAASGMVTLAFAGAGPGPAYQHLSLAGQRRHQQWFYSWLSWAEHHSYREFGEQYFTRQFALFSGAADAQRDLWAAIAPHLSETHRGRRDPLRLGRLPLDFWALLGWLAIAVCIWRRPVLGLVLAAPIAGNFILMTARPIGNARYVHPILPFYFVALSASCGLLLLRPEIGPPEPGWFRRWRSRRARRIVIGAGGIAAPGWFNTDRDTLDVLRREDFLRHWKPASRRAFFAEHVWEHLTADNAAIAARNVFEFLRPGGRLRIAVPDGLNPDPQYLEHVRPGGSGPGADDHQVLWTVESLRQLLLDAGFQVVALEYWDAAGHFHAEPWSSADGHVRRSKRFDPRNQDGTIRYTSLIIDGIKPKVAS
jgi:predicted SAM-dependent methyltransferase